LHAAPEVDTGHPVNLGPTGDIVIGMDRITRAFVEGRDRIRCVTSNRMPPPDHVRPKGKG
jgi:hypothetical protein